MARLDYICAAGHVTEVLRARYGERPACPNCGAATEILWQTSFPNIIGDECDFTIHNLSDQPEHFTSKAEHRRRCKELGVVVKDRHVGFDHTDKSPFTTKWE
ncbi:MAG TPA: hypothetical protein VGJ80_06320 [Gemmatimonadales bacterium]|jgi:hypothetical protein